VHNTTVAGECSQAQMQLPYNFQVNTCRSSDDELTTLLLPPRQHYGAFCDKALLHS
jgi:hypothetical protein